MALDEQALRKPGFNPERHHFVALADRQFWGVRRPHWRHRFIFEDGKLARVDGVVQTKQFFGYDQDTDDLLEALATDAMSSEAVISAVASIVATLLKRSYTLGEIELDSLLCFRASDPTTMQWLRDATAVITYQEDTLPALTLQEVPRGR